MKSTYCNSRSTGAMLRSLARPSVSHCPFAWSAGGSEARRRMASIAPTLSYSVPQLTAPSLAHATQQQHVSAASQYLDQHGILKINLDFPDPKSHYLEQLVLSLHKNHGHQLPISHSASRGWFWDVRPGIVNNKPDSNHASSETQNASPPPARSETMEEFPWHTDCSYEDLPPRYFALHVLQHDRFGGGTLSALNVKELSEQLSTNTRESLMRQEYGIRIPLEFIKESTKRKVVGSILTAHHTMRFRRDLITPLTDEASQALQELDASLQNPETCNQITVHLHADDLVAGSIILMDNRRWLHSRNDIKDPERHLRRVRWDAVPFNDAVMAAQTIE